MRPHPVLALVAANLRRHSRDRVGLFFIVVMPFVSIIFVGMALGGGTAASRLPVGVVAQDSDPVAAAVLTELRAHPDLEITTVAGEDELRADVREGALAAGLVIPPGSTKFELVMTQSNGSGMAARSAVDVAVGKVAAVLEATRAATSAGATPAEAAELVRKAQDASADGEEVNVKVVNADTASGSPRGFAYTAPANLLLFTFINSMAVAAALAESRRIGMLQRAFTAPVRRGAVLFGEALSRFLVAAAQAVLIMVVSSLLFGVSWGEPLGVAAVVGVFALVSTGAAILMGSLVRSSAQPSAIGPPLGIVLGMLGGCLWPSEAAGDVLNAIGRLFPHAWGMDALLTLSRPGTGLGDVLLDVAVLALMAAALLSLSLVLFSRRTRTL
ncbi:putative ABC transporter (ATP-binding protein) [Acrocarpospora pleiomorpha]|uniref:Putative ABC transporter (ATP-binding protein) n=1 Tax=Acrocarpospora pleiomorpha TaxID=90975 RepID=A0A5M3XSY3_9ACTN|nr:ABC transporter permease [Acrocarpospora pleiomorpha]GES21498.1 putative ABC transporter (ATP-binding protein) [Acrocarpospora pleiomorpha]